MSENFVLKKFRGIKPTTKIFYTKFFCNEIISFENFPDYGMSKSLMSLKHHQVVGLGVHTSGALQALDLAGW